MPNKNETGKKARSIAGSVLAATKGIPKTHWVVAMPPGHVEGYMLLLSRLGMGDGVITRVGTVGELETVMGSDLKQSPRRGTK